MTTMKTTITTLILAAAVATPAMAAGLRHTGAAAPNSGFAYDETADGAYGAYAYAPDVTGSVPPATSPIVWHNGRYAGADPDPDVRLQLQIQADLIDR